MTRALRQLGPAGIAVTDGCVTLSLQVFADASAGRIGDPAAGEWDPRRAAVLRAFLDETGRLARMPSAGPKREVVLEHVVQRFEIGRAYDEKGVNEVLRGVTADHVTLRRYLVDADLLDRDGGTYWRSGGVSDL